MSQTPGTVREKTSTVHPPSSNGPGSQARRLRAGWKAKAPTFRRQAQAAKCSEDEPAAEAAKSRAGHPAAPVE